MSRDVQKNKWNKEHSEAGFYSMMHCYYSSTYCSLVWFTSIKCTLPFLNPYFSNNTIGIRPHSSRRANAGLALASHQPNSLFTQFHRRSEQQNVPMYDLMMYTLTISNAIHFDSFADLLCKHNRCKRIFNEWIYIAAVAAASNNLANQRKMFHIAC